MNRKLILAGGGLLLALTALAYWALTRPPSWNDEEIVAMRGLWIGSLPPLPPDASNAYAEDPRAAALGQHIFFDTRFSVDGSIACASCHVPELMFTDGLARGQGLGTMPRKTMTIIGTAHSPWQFWDGRKDSQWAQALGPLESPIEHGGTRLQYAHMIASQYRAEYEEIFGALPDFPDAARFPAVGGPVDDPAALAAWNTMTPDDRAAVTRVYVNIGKAIAAYERRIMPAASRFDRYVEAVLNEDAPSTREIFSSDEIAGLRLFIGRAQCTRCHNGPLFTNNDFHNTGVPTAIGLDPDDGRSSGVQLLLEDEFNCLSQWSDAEADDCADLRFATTEGEELVAAFKPPTLRNVAETAPYMHAGQFATLEQVLAHYNHAPASPLGHSELEPLALNPRELAQLVAFLRTLSGGVDAPSELLQAP